MEASDPPDEPRISYAEFGARFFEHAVTEGRIVGALAGIAGDRIEFGPIGAGPAKVAQVTAKGEIGKASAERIDSDEVTFRLAIPVDLDLHIDLGLDDHRYHADVVVSLTLTARAAHPLRVVIDVDDPTWRDVDVKLEAEGLRGAVLQRVAGIDREIGRFVAKYVARELDKNHIVKAKDIDVAARIDGAWKG